MSTTDLTIDGMTCAACVSRVEKRLARIAGVTASVNLATGRARVNHPASVDLEDLLAAIGGAAGRPLDAWGQAYFLRPGMPIVTQQRIRLPNGASGVSLVQRPARVTIMCGRPSPGCD